MMRSVPILVLSLLILGGCSAGYYPAAPVEAMIIQRQASSAPAAQPANLLAADRIDVHGQVEDVLARIRMTEHFESPTATINAADIALRLPDDASVHDFTINIGQRQIRAVICDADEAPRLYAMAIQDGLTASLVAETAGTVAVAMRNLPAGQAISVELEYFDLLATDNRQFTLRLPLPAAREIGGDVDIHSAWRIEKVQSSSVPLSLTRPADDEVRVVLGPTAPPEDGYLSLSYTVAGDAPRTAVLCQPDAAGGYFAILALSPVTGDPPVRDFRIGFGAAHVTELYPAPVQDSLVDRSELICGRYDGSTPPVITCSGRVVGHPIQWSADSRVLPSCGVDVTWARLKLDHLASAWQSSADPAVLAQIKQTALDYSLVSEFTSLLVVDATGRTNNRGTP